MPTVELVLPLNVGVAIQKVYCLSNKLTPFGTPSHDALGIPCLELESLWVLVLLGPRLHALRMVHIADLGMLTSITFLAIL